MSEALALIGFMGAGKTRIGRLTARRLGLPFVDTDAVITGRYGPIAEIFAERGEEGFREIERDVVLAELGAAETQARVVALGGGAPTVTEVAQALRRLAHVVWLDAPPDVLFARAARGDRPLARDEGAFRRLYEERRPLYAGLATLALLVTDDMTPGSVARRVALSVQGP